MTRKVTRPEMCGDRNWSWDFEMVRPLYQAEALLLMSNALANKKRCYLDFTKQIGTRLLLDYKCMDDYLSAGSKLFNPR